VNAQALRVFIDGWNQRCRQPTEVQIWNPDNGAGAYSCRR